MNCKTVTQQQNPQEHINQVSVL